jgi:hypothetical protein
MQFSNRTLNKSRGGKVERLVMFITIMKKILFALAMLALGVSALPQARGADVSIDFFYNNISGGNWIEVDGYGYGWQPDVVVSDPNWRPYADGYWAYTDYGWTWISYEDFGWATYHYGRWANLADYGWVWFPGSDLDWGPAWVSWRTGGDHIGWAPLPPRGPGIVYEGQPIGARVDIELDIGPLYYNFCDVRFIGEPVLRDRIFPPTQNVTYIQNTVNVTNITVQNNVVYNYGPDYNVVSRYSSRPIQRLTIERQSAADLSAAAKTGALTKVQGNKLVVAAPPKIAKAPATAKPAVVKAKVAQPKVERGWQGVPDKAQLEQKIKTENPKNVPPPTRAAERAAGSPAAAGAGTPAAGGAARQPTVSPGPRGTPARAGARATATPAVASPSPVQRGKPTPAGRLRPGATATPAGAPTRVSPSPAGVGRPTPAGRPGLERATATPAGPAARSPQPFERERPGARTPIPGAAGSPERPTGGGAARGLRPTPPPAEHGRPPTQRLGESPAPGGGAGNVPPGRARGLERERLGTPPPTGAGAREPRGGEPRTPPGVRHPATTPPAEGGPPGQAQGMRQRGPGAAGQPPGQPRGGAAAAGERGPAQPRGGAPAGAERSPGQPEGGKKKPARETPAPGQQ